MTSFCYILECADGSYYTGWSNDPDRRLKAHNAGKGARYTRSRRPVRLVYLEELPDRASAMRRERQIKALARDQKKKLIQRLSPSKRVLGEQGAMAADRDDPEFHDPTPFTLNP